MQHPLCTIVVVIIVLVSAVQAKPGKHDVPCGDLGMAKFNLTVNTFWTEDRFHKQFPTFRPHAQWAKLIGRTHSNHYRLWEEDSLSSEGVMEYAEKGTTEILDLETQGSNGILDIFNTPNINLGLGSVSVKVLADPYHSQVSLMSRMIPSPDWFIGVNSLDLCQDGEWVEKMSIDMHPYDAGTDRGFTFTAPNWPEIPYKKIHKITSKFPNHDANSLYYPELDELPTLASLTIKKVDTVEKDKDLWKKKKSSTLNDEQRVKQSYPRPQEPASYNHGESYVINQVAYNEVKNSQPEYSMFRTDMRPKSYTSPPPSTPPTSHNKHTAAFPVSCEVSDWQDWSPCSKTCGYGTRIRTRLQLSPPKNGGAPCPVLKEEELCGSMRSCTWQHFNTFSGGSSSNSGKKSGRRRTLFRKRTQRRRRPAATTGNGNDQSTRQRQQRVRY